MLHRILLTVTAGGLWIIAAALPVAADAADVAAVARQLLDDNLPQEQRVKIVEAHPDIALALIREMTRDLEPGNEEYRRIPWIWRVAITDAKRGEGSQLREILAFSLPEQDQPLRDWQAVVIGGGVINGLSLNNIWPRPHIAGLLKDDAGLTSRWDRLLVQAGAMADDENVPTGTRYDALRILGCGEWDPHGAHVMRYLAEGTHEELQMGAVSGLVDLDARQSTRALLAALSHLQGTNRALALDGLLRGPERAAALLDAIEEGRLSKDDLGPQRAQALREHENPRVRARAARLLPAGQ